MDRRDPRKKRNRSALWDARKGERMKWMEDVSVWVKCRPIGKERVNVVLLFFLAHSKVSACD